MTRTHTARDESADTEGADPPEPPEPDPSPTRPSDGTTPKRRASDPGARHIAVDLIDTTRTLDVRRQAALRENVSRAASHAGAIAGELRLKLIDDDAMSAAHAEHCGEPGTTDVITFNMTDDGETTLDADLLLCVDEAQRHSRERGHDLVRELTLYALHGALHCLGEDDADESGYDQMHAREDEILRAICIGATFDATRRDGDAS